MPNTKEFCKYYELELEKQNPVFPDRIIILNHLCNKGVFVNEVGTPSRIKNCMCINDFSKCNIVDLPNVK
jgi:hypothetical protein